MEKLVDDWQLKRQPYDCFYKFKSATDMIDHVCGRFLLRWDEEFVGCQAQFLCQPERQRQAGIIFVVLLALTV